MNIPISKKRTLVLMTGVLACVMAQTSVADTITAKFTADNSYQVWVGNATSVTSPDALLQKSNTSANQIFNATEVTFDAIPQCHVYLVAWSDDFKYQGLIGQFDYKDNNGVTQSSIYTGNANLKVLPAQNFGAQNLGNLPPGDPDWPDNNSINTWIGNATDNDWKDPFVGGTNNPPNNIWASPVNGIDAQARWIWHESGTDNSNMSPFDGHDHDEPLIFRIPCPSPPVEYPPPCPCGEDTVWQERAGVRQMWAVSPQGQYLRHYWDGSAWQVETLTVKPSPRVLVGRTLQSNHWGWGVVAVDDRGFINITSYVDNQWINGRPIQHIIKRFGGFDPCSVTVTSKGIWGMTTTGHLLHLFPENGWQWEEIDTKGNAEAIVGCSLFETFDGGLGGMLENGQVWTLWDNGGQLEFDYFSNEKAVEPENCGLVD